MKVFKILTAVLLLAVLFSLLGGYLFLRSRLADRSGEFQLAGLNSPVEVLYDRWGVPHIYAEDNEDAYRALGYVHAQDRWFQMELLRRVAYGRLSEILGPDLLQIDKMMRTIGMGRFAQKAAEQLKNDSGEKVNLAHAYLEGVNACVQRCPSPIEFFVLGIKPQPFVVADIYAISAYMSYTFAQAFKTDPLLTYVQQKLGNGYLDALNGPFPVVTIPAKISTGDNSHFGNGHFGNSHSGSSRSSSSHSGSSRSDNSYSTSSRYSASISGHLAEDGAEKNNHSAKVSLAALADIQQIGRILEKGRPFQIPYLSGSNSWSITPSLSASGSVIFAGDPHIEYASPAVWYEAHIKTPQLELYGHYLALVPFALLGHSRHHAWSLTVFLNDDIDFYQERSNPKNPDQVWHQNGWHDLQKIGETIAVKGQADEPFEIRISPRGPIINDIVRGVENNSKPVAMRWYLYQFYLNSGADFMQSFYELGKAKNFSEARRAIAQIYAPGLNVVYGDREGNIAWWAAAKLPLRPVGNSGDLIVKASSPAASIAGYAPFSSNPQSENPAVGFVFSANQRTTERFPGYYIPPYRANRIISQLSSLIQSGKKISIEDVKRLQTDSYHQGGIDLRDQVMPVLEGGRNRQEGEIEGQALQVLKNWQGYHELEGIAPVIYNEYFYQLLRHLFLDELGEDYFEDLCRSFLIHEATANILKNPASVWWDNTNTADRRESAEDIIIAAWKESLAVLQKNLGSDVDSWRWKRVHRLEHPHPFSLVKALKPFFNVGPFPAVGGAESLNNLGFWPRSGLWPPRLGPSTRRVIDFANPGRSWGILPTGQSGYFFDDHYDDQAELYAANRYRYQYMDMNDIQEQSVGQLTLLPDSPAN